MPPADAGWRDPTLRQGHTPFTLKHTPFFLQSFGSQLIHAAVIPVPLADAGRADPTLRRLSDFQALPTFSVTTHPRTLPKSPIEKKVATAPRNHLHYDEGLSLNPPLQPK